MGIRKYTYLCDRCSATKMIVDNNGDRTGWQVAPATLLCGWRDCQGTMTRASTKDINPFDFRDGATVTVAEAKKLLHTDATFRSVVEYATMFALTEDISPMAIDAFKDYKERIRMAAALALVIESNREKEVGDRT